MAVAVALRRRISRTVTRSPLAQSYATGTSADGTLITADFKGSIHQVGAHVQGAPACNGWQFWCLDVEGTLVPIDLLRQQIRAEMARGEAQDAAG